MKIQGSTVLLTGQGTEVDKMIARHFVGLGAKVALLIEDPEAMGELNLREGRSAVFKTNFREEDSVRRSFQAAIDTFKEIRIFIHANYGRSMEQLLDPKSGESFRTHLAANLTSKFFCCKYAANHLKGLNKISENKETGVIINVTSITAIDGPRGSLAYASSMAAVQGMTVPMSRDLGKFGIRVLSVAVGGIKELMTAATPPQIMKFLIQQTPLGDMPSGEDLASVLEMAAACHFLNGEVIRFDGGLRLPHL